MYIYRHPKINDDRCIRCIPDVQRDVSDYIILSFVIQRWREDSILSFFTCATQDETNQWNKNNQIVGICETLQTLQIPPHNLDGTLEFFMGHLTINGDFPSISPVSPHFQSHHGPKQSSLPRVDVHRVHMVHLPSQFVTWQGMGNHQKRIYHIVILWWFNSH